MNYEIIKMNEENAIEYARINTLSWVQSYKGIINQDFLDKINTLEEIEKMKQNLINGINDGSKRFILKYDGKYVGLFRVRKTKYEGYESYGELGALYLLDEAKNKGLGKILFQEAVKELKKIGYNKMIIGCLEDNPSNDFYKHMGALFEKKNPIKIGEQDLFENIYILEI